MKLTSLNNRKVKLLKAEPLRFKPQAVIVPLVFALFSLMVLSSAGCGGDDAAGTTGTATTTTRTTSTASTPAATTATVEVPPAPAPAPEPIPTPPSSGGAGATALRIVDYGVSPDPVHAGAALTCMVTVEGTATAVQMGLTGPSGSTPQTVNLVEGTTVGGVTNWTATVTAPSTAGGWRFGATAIATDGTKVIPDAGGLSASLLPFEVIP